MSATFDFTKFNRKIVDEHYFPYNHWSNVSIEGEDDIVPCSTSIALCNKTEDYNDILLLTMDNFQYVLNTLKEIKEENMQLKNRIKELEDAIDFHPELEEATNAKKHFESLAQKQN